MSLSRLVYDDIYEIGRNHNNLINLVARKKKHFGRLSGYFEC